MSSSVAIQPDAAPIVACTISRDVQNFDLLIEDMETELGEAWGDLSIDDAVAFFGQPEADTLEFVAIAIDDDDEEDLAKVAMAVKTAVDKGIKVVVIAEEVSPIALHQLLKMGAAEFVPYPLSEGALHDVIDRMRTPAPSLPAPGDANAAIRPKGDREGVIFAVHGLAGGTGSTTLAVNLAWELTKVEKERAPRVCLLDFDLQFGTVSTFLDLPRRDAVYELLSDTEAMDVDSFMQALLPYNDTLQVLTAPNDMLPLDLLTSEDVERIVEMARSHFDYVVIDMPTAVVQWTETVLNAAHLYFTTLELDMRSAQNALRMVKALKSEDLPVSKLRHVLNRAPKFTDLSGKSRVKRLAESLDITIEIQLPDGLKPVTQAGDHGLPLAEAAPKNPLRREIQKLAKSVHDVNQAAIAAS